MKKLVAKRNLVQKIFLTIIIVLLLSFSMPVKSQAGIGGLLIDPIYDLFSTIFDIIPGALQAFLVDGKFDNNSGLQDVNIFNFYLANKDVFNNKVNAEPGDENYDENYAEFAYSPDAEAQKVFKASELDKIGSFGTYAIPMLKYTPEKIFAGLIPALDINFINPTNWRTGNADYDENNTLDEEDSANKRSIAIQLHEVIASWYVSLRNLTVVGLMLVLVYVGIRMIISSTASDKAKYKQLLYDWLIAMCIVFCLHYIMTFTITIVTEISQAIVGSTELNGNNIGVQVVDDAGNVETEFSTDLMGLIRFQMQYNTVPQKILYLILYMAMVVYTCMFTFYYLRRVLTMAFLTLISPLVALTYPIDKMRDGKAQAFDMWLKEYVFNALIQPFHLIIYSIFVGSAAQLAADNPLFAIIALAFITPAEKILRRFFGFDKAGTAGALGAVAGIAGGAAVMSGLKSLMAPKKGSANKKSNSSIKTKQRLEGDVLSLGDNNPGLSGRTSENITDNQEIQLRQNNLEQQARRTESEKMELPSDASMSGMHQTASGLFVPDTRTTARSTQNTSQNETRKSTSENAQSPTRFTRIANARKSVRDMAHSAKTKYNSLPKPIRGVANVALQTGKAVGKATLKAAPGAMVGLSAGIAGDELGDMWKYTLAGAAISSTVGSSAITQAGSFIADSYNSVALGTDEEIIANQEKQYIKSNEWDDTYRHEFKNSDGSELSSSQLKAKKQQGAFYDSRGIQGEDAIKAVKLEDKIKKDLGENTENFDAQNYTARIMKIAKPYTADKLRKDSEVQSLTNSLTKEIMKGGLDQKSATEQAKLAVKYIKQSKGIKE